jgi:sigma-B regulation protein RsbU (phosphoserine phosphatase)
MAAAQNTKSRRILVVTSTPEDVQALREQLGEPGYEWEQAASANSALKKIAQQLPDLVLLEVSKADDSIRFCKGLRAKPETEALPIIAIAVDCGAEQEAGILDAGADGFICRPFQGAELLSRVRTLLRLKDLHDRVAEQNRELLDMNARLDQLNQELMGRNRELEDGMAMAHRLQEALLPQHYPHTKNIGFSHAYSPADAIGGDFFQIIGMQDGRAAIFIADVSGHGVRAAIVMSIVKTVIDYIDMNDKTPTQVLSDFNSRFRGVLGPLSPQIYATGVLMMVDGERRLVTAACAGHPTPIHIVKKRRTAEPLMELDSVGPAMGFLVDPDYPTVEKELAVGDIVLGFTDGVYEVLNPAGDMFGLARLEQLVAANTRLIPRDLIQRIVTETEQFRGAPKRPDDICLVAFEVY